MKAYASRMVLAALFAPIIYAVVFLMIWLEGKANQGDTFVSVRSVSLE